MMTLKASSPPVSYCPCFLLSAPSTHSSLGNGENEARCSAVLTALNPGTAEPGTVFLNPYLSPSQTLTFWKFLPTLSAVLASDGPYSLGCRVSEVLRGRPPRAQAQDFLGFLHLPLSVASSHYPAPWGEAGLFPVFPQQSLPCHREATSLQKPGREERGQLSTPCVHRGLTGVSSGPFHCARPQTQAVRKGPYSPREKDSISLCHGNVPQG